MSVDDDMRAVLDEIQRADYLIRAGVRQYAVVVMGGDAYSRMLVEQQNRAPLGEPWRWGDIPLFGLPVKIESGAPDEPFVQLRMTPDQLAELIDTERRNYVLSYVPTPVEPTLKDVLKKWWKGIKR